MTTINQIIRHGRAEKKRKKTSKELEKCPQKKGICLLVTIRTPRKPNSAKRKVAKVKLSNGFEVNTYIPGEGHSLQQHSIVLVRGGGVSDLPGVNYKLVRGKYDLDGVEGRKQSRSKYGRKHT